MNSSSSSSSSSYTPQQQNWLAFSLSNYSQQLPLFQPNFLFSSSNPNGGVVLNGGQDHQNGGPKLENLLGGSGAATDHVGAPQFNGGSERVGIELSDQVLMYHDDLELKTIAATFLRGFSNEQNDDVAQKQLAVVTPPIEPPPKKAVETFGQRTSIFRGVTRHRWTGRYEAHLWDNSCRREGQSRKGRQVYLGGYDKEEKAARAYDLAALKYWGLTTTTNFPVSDYEKEVEEMKNMTRQEFVASLRRKSSGFSRGASIYRGVTRHHQHGRWQARIGRVAGNKDLYLGTFSTQEEAAEAYDIAAIKFRGLNAVTNFDMSRYDVRSIASSNLPVGGLTNKTKGSSESLSDNKSIEDDNVNKDLTSVTCAPFSSQNPVPSINYALPMKQDQSSNLWAALGYQNHPAITNNVEIPQGTMPFSMEFQHSSSVARVNNGSDNEGVGGYHREEGSNKSSGSGSAATCIAGIDGSNIGTTWIAPPSVHTFQSAKTSLSALQTPIFGME